MSRTDDVLPSAEKVLDTVTPPSVGRPNREMATVVRARGVVAPLVSPVSGARLAGQPTVLGARSALMDTLVRERERSGSVCVPTAHS